MIKIPSSLTKTPPNMPDLTDLWQAAMEFVPFDGWSEEALNKALAKLGYPAAALPIIAPGGVLDVVTAFCNAADDYLQAHFTQAHLHSLRIRDRIALLVKERILWHAPYREATRRTVAYFMHPYHLTTGQTCLWHSADTMWYLAGDTATDFNYYTKRSLLEYVYTTTLIFWLKDTSPHYQESWKFLDRRVHEVLKMGHNLRNLPETARRTLKRIPILRMFIPKRPVTK